MDLNEYQRKAAETAIYPNRNRNLIYPIIGLGGEAGEALNKLKKLMRSYNLQVGSSITTIAMKPKPRKLLEEIHSELGDVLWYIALCADELGSSLETVARANIDKLSARVKNDTIEGDGDGVRG